MSKLCTTCFNGNNDAVDAEFTVKPIDGLKTNKYILGFCLPHLLEWIGYFYKKQNWPPTDVVTLTRLTDNSLDEMLGKITEENKHGEINYIKEALELSELDIGDFPIE